MAPPDRERVLDLSFVEPDEIPQPPERVRVREIMGTPLPDGRRIRISIRLTPFLEPPTVVLAIVSPGGKVISEATVVEADQPNLELIMHLREDPQEGRYLLRGKLSYGEDAAGDVGESHFVLSEV